jgi:hypothetical protein
VKFFYALRGASGRGHLWLSSLTLALLTIALRWPGALIGDSVVQLAEIRSGHLTDWHPPLMAVVWRAMDTSAQAMLALQNLIYWLGFALLSDRLWQDGRRKWAGLMLVVGLSPLSLNYLGAIQKDTLLTSLFVLATGLTACFGARAGAVSAFIGMLTRANAVFAFGPYAVLTRSRPLRILLCLIVAAVLVPVSSLINQKLLGAAPSHVEKSLQLFDLAGIERYSGHQVLGRNFSRCYSPFYWDSLELGCKAFTRTPENITSRWVSAIADEPVAYARHRLSNFNHNIYFLVPPLQECVLVPQFHKNCRGSPSLLLDAMSRNALFWPVTWLMIGLIFLSLPLDPLAETLALSALLYGFAYVIVGVASGFRYFYWTEVALQIALLWQTATVGLPQWRRLVFPVLLLWTICYLYRYLPMVV